MEFKIFEPFFHVERAELARLAGDEVTRHSELREAHRLFLKIGAPIRAAEIAKELGPMAASWRASKTFPRWPEKA
jgi:hypothetical protein